MKIENIMNHDENNFVLPSKFLQDDLTYDTGPLKDI